MSTTKVAKIAAKTEEAPVTLEQQLDAMPDAITSDVPTPNAEGDKTAAIDKGEVDPAKKPDGKVENAGEVDPTKKPDGEATPAGEVDPAKKPDGEVENAGEIKAKEKVVDPVAQRIGQLTKAKTLEMEARIAAEKRSILLEGEIETLKQKMVDGNVNHDTPPAEKDFTTFEEYNDALASWKAAKQIAAGKAEELKEAGVQAQVAAERTFNLQVAQGREKFPDFDQVALKTVAEGGPIITTAMMAAMQDGESFGELAHHLGSNVEESKRIAGLDPVSQIKAIALLENTLAPGVSSSEKVATAEKANDRTISGAPDPITPITGASAVTKDPSTMSQGDFETQYKAGAFK